MPNFIPRGQSSNLFTSAPPKKRQALPKACRFFLTLFAFRRVLLLCNSIRLSASDIACGQLRANRISLLPQGKNITVSIASNITLTMCQHIACLSPNYFQSSLLPVDTAAAPFFIASATSRSLSISPPAIIGISVTVPSVRITLHTVPGITSIISG